MMADIPRGRAVCRLLPSVSEARGEYRALTIGGELTKVVRWMLSGSPDDYPRGIVAEWVGDPGWRPVEFSPGADEAPIVGRRVADEFRADFEASGSLLPLVVDGKESDEWFLFLVEQVVDCLDLGESSEPEWDGVIRKSVFRPDAVPSGLPVFRVPQSTKLYWNEWAADRLRTLAAPDVETRLIWSADPTRTPHPDPWSF
ncbi:MULTISPECIES: hypothetical protein [unclassified Amycolatopsis]|uniref:hypothetical protein n=1 Tax=unclassified Amycolatopsis TaxID=2618356 RepID=UPI00196AFB5A|nr:MULTISPECIES: hypothetical protein [unclassified Amycolatopsis]